MIGIEYVLDFGLSFEDVVVVERRGFVVDRKVEVLEGIRDAGR